MGKYIFIVIIGYMLGCLQWSYILGKSLKNVDIRTLGSGNAGASNAVISLGWRWGSLVAILDILKAIISILLIKYLLKDLLSVDKSDYYLYLNGLSVILGHNHPFYMNFKGGKGTASLIGMMIAIDRRIAIIGIIVILLTTIITDYIALGSIALAVTFIGTTVFFKYGRGNIIIAIIIALMSIYNHIPNIKRIIEGKELGLRMALKM
ncbi:MAG: glycerol-3-phosphate acyltransferase [Tissierellia bacterium]|nr:glycerol-3-phosphate acyltransferase [Tissierellia bacterium]